MATVITLVVLVALGVWAYKWLKSRAISERGKNLTEQAQKAVAEHKDKIYGAVDGVSVAANEKTHGRYEAQIAKVGQKASDAVEKLSGEAGANRTADAPATQVPAAGPSFAGGPSFTDAPATEAPAAGPSFAGGPSFTDAPATEAPAAGPSFAGGPSFTDAPATEVPAAGPSSADTPASAAPSDGPTFDE